MVQLELAKCIKQVESNTTMESVYMGLRFKVKRIGRVNLVHKMNHNPIQGMQEATLSSTFGQEKNNEVTRQRWLKGKFKSFSPLHSWSWSFPSYFFSFIDISLLSFNQIICSNLNRMSIIFCLDYKWAFNKILVLRTQIFCL